MKKITKLVALIMAVLMLLPMFAMTSSAAPFDAELIPKKMTVDPSGTLRYTIEVAITPNPSQTDNVVIDAHVYSTKDIYFIHDLVNNFTVNGRTIEVFDLPKGSYYCAVDVYINSAYCGSEWAVCIYSTNINNYVEFYDTIRANFLSVEVFGKLRYTTSSWNAYKNAWDKLENFMDSDRSGLAGDEIIEKMDTLMEDLLIAYRGLEYRLKFLDFWYKLVDKIVYWFSATIFGFDLPTKDDIIAMYTVDY